ncbi:hypothetical protein JW964_20430 [candidate division KSB1 bacterium]|nr:hypothetical protein [candidate division KSB1 bacterium]
MGQFLAIGLATQIGVTKKEVAQAQLNSEQLQEKMKKDLYHVPEIYAVNEYENEYSFTLKNDIFYEQLLPLLRTLYPLLYRNAAHYDHILKKLHELPPSEWITWAKDESEEAFQFDLYGMGDLIKANHVDIHLYYQSLLLSLEGKIFMEVFGRQFNFLKYTMIQTFKQFTLSGALRIYITG